METWVLFFKGKHGFIIDTGDQGPLTTMRSSELLEQVNKRYSSFGVDFDSVFHLGDTWGIGSYTESIALNNTGDGYEFLHGFTDKRNAESFRAGVLMGGNSRNLKVKIISVYYKGKLSDILEQLPLHFNGADLK